MPGDDRVRTCGDCRKRVYNLAAMTRAEAEALIASRENPCVRLYRRSDGTVVTADCAPPLRKIRRRVLAGAFATLAGGCVDDSMEPSPDEAATIEDEVVQPRTFEGALGRALPTGDEGVTFTLTMGATIENHYIIDIATQDDNSAIENESTEE